MGMEKYLFPYFTRHAITYSRWGYSKSMLMKGDPGGYGEGNCNRPIYSYEWQSATNKMELVKYNVSHPAL